MNTAQALRAVPGTACVAALSNLTACAPETPYPATSETNIATEATVETAPSTPTTTAASATPSALALCGAAGQKLTDYPTYVLDISKGKFDPTTHREYLEWADEMSDLAPADATVIVAKYTDPIYRVQEVVEAGGGELNFSSADFKDGSLKIMAYCVDAGYTLPATP